MVKAWDSGDLGRSGAAGNNFLMGSSLACCGGEDLDEVD
jgi:hypothetical protein